MADDSLDSILYGGIKESTKKVPIEFKKMLKELNLQRELDIIDQRTYYNKLASLRDTYLEQGTAQWWDYTKKILNYQKGLVKEQKENIMSLYSDITKQAGISMDEVLRLQHKMEGKLGGYGNLFDKIKIRSGTETSEYIQLRDLKQDTIKLEAYKRAIMSLKDRGGTTQLLDSIMGMDIDEGTKFANKLLGLDDNGFENYINSFKEKQLTAKSIANDIYASSKKDVIEKYKDELISAGLTVPNGFFDSGKASAINFGEGFINEIDSVMEKIKQSINANMQDISFNLPSKANSTVNYNNVFEIGTAKDTVSEQIQAWKAATVVEKMRGDS